ncbi:hypothetical protein EDD75_0350 [Thermodesulfitimonas autotrophica]|uniref:Uncharacterized protein n=1 Tax=Thermodesulfitimonas autotrophica TaxID=1894989 RepID=A0A3N5AX16_9THEO|nr:hypothetical protein [Thermodesulfitimonas autotrophica]RPF49534.1 hypothetical protein EDD75_0350 [Thermodesulfitimonas autotrophica]
MPYGGDLIPFLDAAGDLYGAARRLKEKAEVFPYDPSGVAELLNAVEDALRRCRGAAEELARRQEAEVWELDD